MWGLLGRVRKSVALRARRGEGGFTLAELVIAVAILGIVGAALGASFAVTAHDSVGIVERFATSHDAQITSAYLGTDVQSSVGITTPSCSSGSGGAGAARVEPLGVSAIPRGGEWCRLLRTPLSCCHTCSGGRC